MATSFLNKRSGTQFYHDWKPMQSIIDMLHKNFQEDHTNSRRFPGRFLNSSRFPEVVDTLKGTAVAGQQCLIDCRCDPSVGTLSSTEAFFLIQKDWYSWPGVVCVQWVPEITHHCQRTPFLLVGTQVDLRDNPATVEKLAKNRQKPISFEMGEKLAKELKAVKYVECSALTQVYIWCCY